MKRAYQGKTYRELQKANTQLFKALAKSEQQALKNKGYNNRGWDNIIKSHELLTANSKVISLNKYRGSSEVAIRLGDNLKDSISQFADEMGWDLELDEFTKKRIQSKIDNGGIQELLQETIQESNEWLADWEDLRKHLDTRRGN